MRRDRLTFGMMIGVPLLQLVLFGFAINSDPKHLPTAVLLGRPRPAGAHAARRDSQQRLLRRSFARCRPRRRRTRLLARGDVQFVVTIPGELQPRLSPRRPARRSSIEADATDPGRDEQRDRFALRTLLDTALRERPERARSILSRQRPNPVELRVHAALQPRGDHAIQHRARPHGRGPDHDDGDDHRPRHHSRTRDAARWKISSPCRRGRSRC